MSDKIEELSRKFAENVLEENARSVGLFPIPEYPEFEQRGMWSSVLTILLTTLRYLAPATLLTLLWVQPNCVLKLLKYIDSAVRSLAFSSEEQKQDILKWLAEAGPVRVDSLDVVWRQGWIVCGVLDMALPGACAGHPPSKLSLKHAQVIAEHYLGIDPIFTRQELEAYESLSKHQEYKLLNFLENIRLALSRLKPPTPKHRTMTTQKNVTEPLQNCLDYVAKGSGLTAIQINNKVYFKIYPTAQQSLNPDEITITIYGPRGVYGKTILEPILGKAQLIRQNLLKKQTKSIYTENALPITHGTTYMRSYGRNDVNKTFFIPKTKYDIEIETDVKEDHARVSYTASLEGKYKISITSSGKNIVGSPFIATASKNVVEILEKDNFFLENGEEINIIDTKTDKNVVLKVVDYGVEKMLLKESGAQEKIHKGAAKKIKESNFFSINNNLLAEDESKDKHTKNKQIPEKFYKTAIKVMIMNRVCKVLQNGKENSSSRKISLSRATQDIPDIVNSTFYDDQIGQIIQEKNNRIIIPKNISVSILTEKSKAYIDDIEVVDTCNTNIQYLSHGLENIVKLKDDLFEEDTISVDTTQSTSNPFLSDGYEQNYEVGKQFGSFVPNEYETNNSQSEETEDSVVKLLDDYQDQNNTGNNPFIDYSSSNFVTSSLTRDNIKSKAIREHTDSVFLDSEYNNELEDVMCSSLKNNPFIKHEKYLAQLQNDKPDFIIGAPVSIPQVFLSSSSEHQTNPCEITTTNCSYNNNKLKDLQNQNSTMTPEYSNQVEDLTKNSNYNSLDSNNSSKITPSETSRELSPKTDIWDSAYVSIDENIYAESTSSESSNSKINNTEKIYSQIRPIIKDIKYIDEDDDITKYEIKRSEITPIIEENEKSFTFGMKEATYGTDAVVTAFTDLDDIYDEIFSNSEVSLESTNQDYKKNFEVELVTDNNEVCVNSASDIITDVKRQTKQREGKISEVQENVTESVSVSQNLHVKESFREENNNRLDNETQFGDPRFINIVSEKKKYWDERIREIEAKSEEIKVFQTKRRLSGKHLRRNDSLTKRKGKKIVQHILKSGKEEYEKYVKDKCEPVNDDAQQIEIFNSTERKDIDSNNHEQFTCFGKKSSENKARSVIDTLKDFKVSSEDLVDMVTVDETPVTELNLKQELSEKVFQAFETSPKRFFGTSRKHILNKIDTFLGLPHNEQETKKNKIDVNHESGLVSSRISLFHNISNTEELPWARRKSKSMHNLAYIDSNKKLSVQNEPTPLLTNPSQTYDNDSIHSENSDCLKSPKRNSTIRVFKEDQNQKQAELTQSISLDETSSRPIHDNFINTETNDYVKNTIKDLNKQTNQSKMDSSVKKLKSISKSEMDIFSRTTDIAQDDGLDKHKSYEELPKICVKNFISHYEDVSKNSNLTTKTYKLNSAGFTDKTQVRDSFPDTSHSKTLSVEVLTSEKLKSPDMDEAKINLSTTDAIQIFEKLDSKDKNKKQLTNTSVKGNHSEDVTFLSFSDIDLEIVEKEEDNKDKSVEAWAQPEAEKAHLEYKNRFTMAKKYFQSLEELRHERGNIRKELLHTSVESLKDKSRPKKRSNIKKSNSMPSSEIAKIWNQMQEQNKTDNTKKFVKISEKFHVEDLFEDVMEGRLSRQGSLRGIPHKKAVLETFRSMENISDNRLNSYEMAVEQLNDFAKENQVRNAQTYLSEYPYLPTTDPSKYHSRLDTTASGLITFKELKKIPRRNSVPDLRLNPTFTADL
ncbi:hypothetical protein KGM_210751 [Danaus plexippus plexippus]|uniref:Uncharacterized protein n=1 Tax=Danaus plexippus plexippus TaxID=278856 RepID=A0A212FDI7_DANPL|nr:hypothetical protein KGM_210751 [Danaus plexippus plexippus]